jgi:ferritin-like metal-binding protein YciE
MITLFNGQIMNSVKGRVIVAEENKLLVSWLKDAHAMEQTVIKNLEKHSENAQDYPDVKTRVDQHIEESRQHAQMLEDALNRLDEKPSGVKEFMGSVMGTMQGAIGDPTGDTLVRNVVADYGAEHFEIATYRAIQRLAEISHIPEVAQMCQQILQDEESMAEFLERNLTGAVESVAQAQMASRAEEREAVFRERLDGDEEEDR